MSYCLRRFGIILLALILMCCLFSCKQVRNRARQADDVLIKVSLCRSYAIDNGEQADPLRNFDYEIEKMEDILWLPMVVVVHGIIQGAVDNIGRTKFVVYPGVRKAYRQRLYWGDNDVYFPRDSCDENGFYKMQIEITGDRCYDGIRKFKPDESLSLELD